MEPSISMPARPTEPVSNTANHLPRMRFSLRSLLVAVTMCALGIVAVVRASHVTLGVVSVATLVAFLVALSTAIYWVGPRRAFAVGFLAWGVPYAALALWVCAEEPDETRSKLITSHFLHSFYPHVQHQTGTQTLYGGFPGGFGGGGLGGFGGGGFPGGAGGGFGGGATPAPAMTGADATAQTPATTSGSTHTGGTTPAAAATQDATGQTAATASGSASTGAPTPAPAPARTWPMVPPGTPTTMPLIEPSLEDWISLGHMMWAWVFAICGGFVTQAIWRRRSTAGER